MNSKLNIIIKDIQYLRNKSFGKVNNIQELSFLKFKKENINKAIEYFTNSNYTKTTDWLYTMAIVIKEHDGFNDIEKQNLYQIINEKIANINKYKKMCKQKKAKKEMKIFKAYLNLPGKIKARK